MSSKSLAPFLFFILVFSPQAYSQATGSATSPQDLPPEILAYPDLILFGGRILTVDDDFSTAQALAIRDGRILAVGDNSRILRMQGPSTEKIDLQERRRFPGLLTHTITSATTQCDTCSSKRKESSGQERSTEGGWSGRTWTWPLEISGELLMLQGLGN